MSKTASAMETLILHLTKLPSVGRKTAERLAFHLLRAPKEDALALAEAIRAMRERIRRCSICGNITEDDPCLICRDERRRSDVVCVVEDPMDIVAFEKSEAFEGVYHVLDGCLSPLQGITASDLRIDSLEKRAREGSVQEIILATNPSVEGEATALYLSRLLEPHVKKITRIGLGVPMGGSLEYADARTLKKALEGRTKVE
ncbi:MAG: recombination mediator RecR [Candidatus Sumerlaeota bacterium]|nr:recombination mediator RecR [Candidatus Sumerlaeota bacterium]